MLKVRNQSIDSVEGNKTPSVLLPDEFEPVEFETESPKDDPKIETVMNLKTSKQESINSRRSQSCSNRGKHLVRH